MEGKDIDKYICYFEFPRLLKMGTPFYNKCATLFAIGFIDAGETTQDFSYVAIGLTLRGQQVIETISRDNRNAWKQEVHDERIASDNATD